MFKNKQNSYGFTLIEVMIVLSVLAIIAILAYNFFGSTMKEANETSLYTKSFNDMRTIAHAVERYMSETGQDLTGATQQDKFDTLVSQGYLKSIPKMSPELATLGDYAIASDPSSAKYDMVGGPAADYFVQAAYAKTEDICKEWNTRFAPEIAGTAPTYVVVGSGSRFTAGRFQSHCSKNPGTPTSMYIRFAISQDDSFTP